MLFNLFFVIVYLSVFSHLSILNIRATALVKTSIYKAVSDGTEHIIVY